MNRVQQSSEVCENVSVTDEQSDDVHACFSGSLIRSVLNSALDEHRSLKRSRLSSDPNNQSSSPQQLNFLQSDDSNTHVNARQTYLSDIPPQSCHARSSPNALNKKEKHFVYIFMKIINNHLQVVTRKDLEAAAAQIYHPSNNASDLESQRAHALNALLWACVANGAIIEGERGAMVYSRRCQESLKHCFDAPCMETLRAHLVVSIYWGQLGDFDKRKRYAKFAELMTHDLQNIPVDLLGSLNYIKAMILCCEKHSGPPLTFQQKLQIKLNPDPVFNRCSVSTNSLNPRLQVLDALSFALNGLWRASNCSTKLRADIEHALVDAIKMMEISKSQNGWDCNVAAVSLRGVLGYIQLIEGRKYDALKNLISIVPLVEAYPNVCMLSTSWHSCQIAAHTLHRFRVKLEYNQLADKLRSMQGKLSFTDDCCPLPNITSTWIPICSRNICPNIVCNLLRQLDENSASESVLQSESKYVQEKVTNV